MISLPLIYYLYFKEPAIILVPDNAEYESFINELSDELPGMSIAGSINQPFIPAKGTLLNIQGEQLQVYEFSNESTANDFSSSVSSNGAVIGSTSVNWAAQPHLFNKSNLVIVYLGNDTLILSTLYSILGSQFAGEFDKNYCAPESRLVDACIELFQPVCGYYLNGSSKTYPNNCFACIDEEVIYYLEGECAPTPNQTVTPPQRAGEDLGVSLDGAGDLSEAIGELLTITEEKIINLAVDEQDAYFYTCSYAGLVGGYESEALRVYSVSMTDKNLTRLLEHNVSLCDDHSLLIDNTSLYLISGESGFNEVFKINKLNASINKLLTTTNVITDLRIDETSIYYLENGSEIKSVSKNGGSPETIISLEESFIEAFNIDLGNIYYAYSNGEEGLNQTLISTFNPVSAGSVAGTELIAVNGEVFQIKGSIIYRGDEQLIKSGEHDYFRDIKYHKGIYYTADPGPLTSGGVYYYNLTTSDGGVMFSSTAPSYRTAPRIAFNNDYLYYADSKYVSNPNSSNYNKTFYYIAFKSV